MRFFLKRGTARSAVRRLVFCGAFGACAVFLICFGYMVRPSFLRYLDLKTYDALLAGLQGGIPSPVPVLVDIDENSLSKYGQWPWPRRHLAELLAAIADEGAAAVGVDILMSEPDRTSVGSLLRELGTEYAINPELQGVPEELMDNDTLLADVLRQMPVVLSSFLSTEDLGASGIKSPNVQIRKMSEDSLNLSDVLAAPRGMVPPIPVLAEAVSAIGYMNAEPDEDGVTRRVPLMLNWNGRPQALLSLLTLNMALGNGPLSVGMTREGMMGISMADLIIPLSGTSFLPVAFRGGRGMYPVWSAADVLEGEMGGALRDKIVFVGSSAAGLMDIRATPFEAAYPGLEMHAAIVDTILSGRFIATSDGMEVCGIDLQIALIVSAGIVSTLLFTFSSPLVFLFSSAFLVGGAVYVSRFYFQKGFFVSPLYVLLTLASCGGALLLARFWMENRDRRMLRAAFSNYVAPEVVRRISSGEPVELLGEQREITVLFTDIRSFTSISERLQPHQIVSLLNRYFTPMTASVRDSMGTIDKFVGDAMMAFWNAPLDVPDHAPKAVDAVLKMKRSIERLSGIFREEFGIALESGAGLHCGVAHVGNMGTAELMNYTAIGDTVNLASRLEGMCPIYGVGFIVSDAIMSACRLSPYYWRKIDRVRVKGRREPVSLYTPLSKEDAEMQQKELDTWNDTLLFYDEGRFREAFSLLEKLRGMAPNSILYEVFAARCADLLASPPPDWDGIYEHEVK